MEVLRSTTSTPSSPTFGARRCLLCRADFACRLDDGKAWEEGRSDMEKLSVVVDAVVVLAVAGPQWWSSKLLCHGCDLALDEISRALSHRLAIRRCFLANVAQLHCCDVIAPSAPPSPQQDALPRSGTAPHATRSNSNGSGCSSSSSVDSKAGNTAEVLRSVADDADSDSGTLRRPSGAADGTRSSPFEANQRVSPRYRDGTPLGNSDGSNEVTSAEPSRPGTVTSEGHIIMPPDCQGHLRGFKDAESTNYAERQQCRSSGYPDRCQQAQKRKSASRDQLLDEANGRPVRKLSRLLETLSAAASAAAAAAAAASLTPTDGVVSPRPTATPVIAPPTKPAESTRCDRPRTTAASSLDSRESDNSASTALRRLSLVLEPGNVVANRQVFIGGNTSSTEPTERGETRKVVPGLCCTIPHCHCSNAEDAAAAACLPAAEHLKNLAAETCNGSSKSCDLAKTSASSSNGDKHLFTPQVTGTGRTPLEAKSIVGAASIDCNACQKTACGCEDVGNKHSSEFATTNRSPAFHASDGARAGVRSRIDAEIDACTGAEFSQVLLHKQLRQQQPQKEHQTQCSSSTGFASLREQLRSSPAAGAGPSLSTSTSQLVGPRTYHQDPSDAPEQRTCLHQAKQISAPCALALPPLVGTRSRAVPQPAAGIRTTEHAELDHAAAMLPKRLPTGQSSARGSPLLRTACEPTSGACSLPSSSFSAESLGQSTAADRQSPHPQVASSDITLSSAVHGKPEVTTRVPPQPCLQPISHTSSPKPGETAGNLVCHPALLMAMTSRDFDVPACSERHSVQAEIVQRNSVSSPSSEQQQRSESPVWFGERKSDAAAKSSPEVSKVPTAATRGLVAATEVDRSETLSSLTKVSGAAKQGQLKLPERGSAMTTLWKLLQQPAYANSERAPLGPSACRIGASPANEHPLIAGQRGMMDTKTCHVADLGVRSSCASSRNATSNAAKVPVAAGSLRGGGVPLSHLLRGAAARALVEAPLSAVRSSSDDCRLSPGAANCNGSSAAAGSATPLLAGMFERLSESPLPPSRRPLSAAHSSVPPAASGLAAELRHMPQPGQPSQAAAAVSRASPEYGRRMRRYPSNHRYSRFPSGSVGTGNGGLSHTSFSNDPCRRRLIRTASVHRSSPNVFGMKTTAHRTLDSTEQLADACEDEADCSGFSSTEYEPSYGQQHQAYATASATVGARGSGRNGETILSPSIKELKSEPVDV